MEHASFSNRAIPVDKGQTPNRSQNDCEGPYILLRTILPSRIFDSENPAENHLAREAQPMYPLGLNKEILHDGIDRKAIGAY